MITIKEIEWYDEVSTQAFYTITDGTYDLNVFQSDGFIQKENSEFKKEILSLYAECLIQDELDYGTTAIYHARDDLQILMGEFTSRGLEIGEFVFERDILNLPGGINIGDYLEVRVTRVDVG